MAVELKPHQVEAVKKLGNGKILVGGVGTGKSLTAIAYYVEKESPRDIYVITTAKKRDSLDWQDEASKYAIGSTPDTTAHGMLTVDSWNNIEKYKEVTDAFFIFDEQRVVGSGAWAKVFIKIAKRNRWILLSATPGDTWLDYIPVFVANGFYKNRTEFKWDHVVYSNYGNFPKVERYVGVGKLVRLRNSILVEMPYQRHTTRIFQYPPIDYDVDLMKKVTKERWHVYEERPLRDVAELFGVMRKVANTDSSRTRTIESLMERHPRLIVFYNFDYELMQLREMLSFLSASQSGRPSSVRTSRASMTNSISREITSSTTERSGTTTGTSSTIRWSGYEGDESCESSAVTPGSMSTATASGSGSGISRMPGETGSTLLPGNESVIGSQLSRTSIAEWNGHKHEPIPTSDRWVYLVQYAAGSEGWNCTETDAMVFYSLSYSYKMFEQAQGRIDRLNTPYSNLYYYVFKSSAQIDRAIWKALGDKQNFQESGFGTNFVE